MSQSQAFCTLYELFFHGYSGKYTSDFCVNETVTLALDYHKPHRAIQYYLPKVKCKSCFYQSKKKQNLLHLGPIIEHISTTYKNMCFYDTNGFNLRFFELIIESYVKLLNYD